MKILVTLFFASLQLVLFSQDITMTLKGSPSGGNIQDVETTSTGNIYAAVSGQGLWKSVDNGTSWTKVNVLGDNAIVDIEIDAANNIYVSSNWYTFSSSDDGLTWTRRNTSPLAFGSNQSWTIRQIKRTGTLTTSPMYALMSYNGQLAKQSVFKSTDNGTSWTEVYSISNLGERITTLAVNASGNVFLNVNNEGVYKSVNGNFGTFSLSNTGLPVSPSPSTKKQSLISLVGTLYGIFGNQVFRSLDNAANWVEVTPPGAYSNLSSGLISGAGSNVYIITPTDLHFWNGATWTSTAYTSSTFNANIINAFKVVSTSLFYVGDNLGISSSNNGTLWTLKAEGLQGLSFANTTQSLVTTNGNFYTQSNPVFSSVDDGVTWTRNQLLHTNLSTQYTRILPFSDGRFFAASGGGGSFSSNNYGETWTAEAPPATTPFLTNDNDIIYAYATPTTVHKSIDRGVTWTSHTITGLPFSLSIFTGSSYFYADGHLYFAVTDLTGSPSVVRFFKVNVTTWAATVIPSPPSAVTFNIGSESIAKHGNTLFIASRNGSTNQLSVSTNEGLTWTTSNVPGIINASFFVTHNGYPVYFTTTGLGRISRDAGATWLSINLGFGSTDFYNPRAALIDDEGYLIVMFDAKGLYKSDTKIQLPEAPTNLTLLGSTFNGFRIEADDNSTNEDSFTVEVSIGNNTNYDSVATIVSNNFEKVLLALSANPETTYYVRLKAVNGAGSSSYSNELMVTTPARCSTPLPQGRSWSLTTLNESGLGVRTSANVTLIGSRFDDYTYTISSVTGSSPNWPSPYPATGSSGSLVVNCGSVLTTFTTNSTYVMDGNGTWNPTTNTLTIKWKVNQSGSTVTPFSETSVLTLNATDPIPIAPIQPFVAASANNAILISWTGYPNYASHMVVERATISTGPWTEVGRQVAPKVLLEDKTTTFIEGQTYFYRLRGSNATGDGINSATTSLIFAKPLFETIATHTLPSYSSRVSTAWIDVNNDGFDDLFYTNSSSANVANFLINKGDGTFEVKPFGASSQVQYFYSKFGDFNNDGNIDMVSQVRDFNNGGTKLYNQIFSGDGQGNFTSVYTSPLNAVSPNGQVQIMDYNRDGLLDVILGSNRTNGTVTEYTLYMLQNMGNNTFQKAFDFFTNEANTTAINLSPIDLNNDDILDLFITGSFDASTNNIRYYQGNADNTFTLTTPPVLPGLNGANTIFSHDWGDIDNDGDLDFLLTQGVVNPTRSLYRNNGNGSFTNFTGSAIAEVNVSTSTAATFGDFNNDGALDIVANHSAAGNPTAPQGYIFLSNLNQNSAAFASATGSNTFNKKEGEVVNSAFVSNNGYNLSDFNKDGYLDLSNSWSDPDARIFKNNQLGTGNWIGIKLVGVQSNRSAIGSRIRVTAGSTVRQRHVYAIAGGIFTGQHSLVQHVGLGNYTGALLVEVTWPNGRKQLVSVAAVNQFVTITEDTDGPVFSNFLPGTGTSNISSSTKLEFTLNEENTAIAGKKINIVKKSTATVVFSLDVTAGVKTNNTYVFTLPSKLELGVEYEVSVDAGAFKDVFQNESPAVAATSWLFTVGQGPLLTAKTPANASTGIAVTQTLSATFSVNVTAVSGKAIRVQSGSETYLTVDATAVAIAGNVVTINAPVANWPYLKSLTVSIDAGAFVDNVNNDFSGLNDNSWTFTTVEEPDITGPVLNYNPVSLSVLDKGFSPANLSIDVTDNKAVTSVTMFHRKLSASAFTELALTAPTSGSNWTTQVLNTMADDMGLEYYFEALDAAGNKSRSPSEVDEHYTSSIRFTAANAPKISLSGEGTVESWRIVAVPYELENGNFQIADVFQSFGAAGEESWRIIRYDKTGTTEKWLEFPDFSTLERGKGYFMNSIGAKEAVFNNATSPKFTRSNLFTLNLVPGWNQIGNPYTVAINWEDVRTFNNVTGNVGVLKLYTNGQYTNGNALQVGQGAFVNVQTAVTVSIPMPGQTSGARMKNDFSKDLASSTWQVPLIVEQGYIRNEFAGVGMHPQASASYDEFDDFNAPRFFDFAEINFSHPEHFQGRFARDIVATAQTHTWSFTVNSNLEDLAVIRWDNTSFGNNQKDLLLVDETTLLVIDMRSENQYSFNPKESRDFKIYFGEGVKDEISVQEFVVGQAYPNPTSGETKIRFSLPQKGGENQLVSVSVKDALGKDVGMVHNGIFTSGYHELSFDASAWQATDGLLLMTMSVSNYEGKSLKQLKIMVKK